MNYVLDASVALKWVLVESDSAKALRLRDDLKNHVHEFHAPDVFSPEVAHALARAERRKLIRPPLGSVFLLDILSTPPVLHDNVPLIGRAFAMAAQYRVGVYDCLYVALAEREGCEFVTADDKLAKNLKPHFPFIVPLASLP
jgi:predicted nucleic acid-binding protein